MTGLLVVGSGLIGARHAAAIQAHPRAQLIGVVDPDTSRHCDPATRYFRDMSEVDAAVDGAIIATPTHLHADHACQAASLGWDILIEKPVAGTLEQADRVDAAIMEHGVQALVGHHRRYHDSIARLREVVQGGGIGTPITATLIWAMRKHDSYFEGNWRTAGGSPVMINLVHDIDLLRHVMGEITDIVGLPGRPLRGSGRLESGSVALQFSSGATAAISFADTAPSPWGFEAGTGENPHIATTGQDMWWITGTKGGISFPSLTHWSGARDWSQAAQPRTLGVDKTVPLDRQLDHFLDVINRQASPMITVRDARQTLAATLRIEELLIGLQSGDENA